MIVHFFMKQLITGIISYGLAILVFITAIFWLIKQDADIRKDNVKRLSKMQEFMQTVKKIKGRKEEDIA